MVLDSLSGALSGALRKLTKAGVVDESLIKELIKDIQKALLLSDVNVKLVFELSKNIESRAMDEKLPKGVSRKEHIIKIVYEGGGFVYGDGVNFNVIMGKYCLVDFGLDVIYFNLYKQDILIPHT